MSLPMFHILHIDQSQEFNKFLSATLCRSAKLSWAPDLSNARKLINTETIDMILLDIVLPDGDGIDFCYSLQSTQQKAPIIVLTSHDDISKKVLSFAAGADDYIIRPFHMIEFQAKLDSKLRNCSIQSKVADILQWKEILINKSKHEVIVFDQGNERKVELTTMEFKVLVLFTSFIGTVLCRDIILDRVWGNDIFVSPRSVDTQISKLRKKLGHVSHIIQSIHGAGYMFCPTAITKT
jgi:two-component system, OmpR family, copper resistance phosphate regulon response regulator CusR